MDAQQNEQQKQSPFDQHFIDPWAEARWSTLHDKLRAAGASDEEVDHCRDEWLHDQYWDHADKVRVLALGDAKFFEELVTIRIKNRSDQETKAQRVLREADDQDASDNGALYLAAQEMSAYEVDSIMQWVGWDLKRARVMLRVEEEHPHSRSEVLSQLLAVIEHRVNTG